MRQWQKPFRFLKQNLWQTVVILLLFSVALGLLWRGETDTSHAEPARFPDVYFEGQYQIGDGPWQTVTEGEHIPTTQGDVTLKGFFHMSFSDGEYLGPVGEDVPVALLIDHLQVTIYEDGQQPYVVDVENPDFGESVCGEDWVAHNFLGNGATAVRMVIHNPHDYGNELAIDRMLENTAVWGGLDLEREIMARGAAQRNAGLLFVIMALVLLGIALFSAMMHIKNSRIIWLLGLAILFAGGYFIFTAEGISFWSTNTMVNTAVQGLTMVFYMFAVSAVAVNFFASAKRAGKWVLVALGIGDFALLLLPLISDVYLYDVMKYWVYLQTAANLVLICLLLRKSTRGKGLGRGGYLAAIVPMVGFQVDAVLTAMGLVRGGPVSKHVFVILFFAALFMTLRMVPHSVNATVKAKELEAEKMALNAQLAESRVSTMISQIRPHFIYNTLGSIEQLCAIDPPKAGELVHNFAKYLRGNFGELDNPHPIRMSQEMEHVRYYISIENVRFPDMTFTFEMNSGDFKLPALTIQPIVENAIKHGLMKLQKGGSIRVVSYETDTHYHVLVEDNGVGFDPKILVDERKHLGLRNIRGRLEAMVNGSLEIQSAPGEGTRVTISIPKEVSA